VNYTYYWTPGGQTTSATTGQAAGTYTVYITDGSDCTGAIATISYNGPTLTLTAFSSSCNAAGSVSVSVNNGTGPYTYLWSPSGDAISSPGGLLPGYHYVTVTDQGSGCVLNDSVYLAPAAASAGTNAFGFSLQGYSPGIYSVQVTTAAVTATRRLVIE
jgi:hypothetical protein